MDKLNIPETARRLSQFTAREVLLSDASPTLKALRDAARHEAPKFDDVWIQLEIEAVRAKSFNFDGLVPEKLNELYVVGWMIDGAGQKSCRTTQVKPGVRKGDLVNFSSNGVGTPIARLKNPKECVYWGFAVMENDAGARAVGGVIETTLASPVIKTAIGSIAGAAGAGAAVVGAVQGVVNLLGGFLVAGLKANKDDLMATHEGGGLDLQYFNAHDPDEAENTESNFARTRYAVHLYRE